MIERRNIADFKGGWFIGNFEPSIINTSSFEVSVKTHAAGEPWQRHYHKEAIEINYVISGTVQINDETYRQGEFFIVHPGTIVDPSFPLDCCILCVKTPSVPGDKFEAPR